MKKSKILSVFSLVFLLGMGLSACSSPESSSALPSSTSKPSSDKESSSPAPTKKPIILKLTAPESSIRIGETLQLEYSIENASDPSVTWKSDNEEIATVDDKGLVTGVSAGEAMISVTSNEDPTKAQAVFVMVKDLYAFTITGNSEDEETYKVEAEDLDMTNATVRPDFVSAGRTQYEDCDTASGGRSICGLIPPTVLSIAFNSQGSCQVDIRFRLAAGTPDNSVNLDDIMTFQLDDEEIGKTNAVLPNGTQENPYFNWDYYSLGTFQIEKGVHEFDITLTGQFCNADCISFIVSDYAA